MVKRINKNKSRIYCYHIFDENDREYNFFFGKLQFFIRISKTHTENAELFFFFSGRAN